MDKICGIIMPISSMEGYDEEHWKYVKEMICDAAVKAGFTPRLVSDSEYSGIIQGDIVKNLYSDQIVVCDVSGRNPNVMFELGMRLAFNKATIIIKDDCTPYSFDTSPVEHIGYQKNLNYVEIKKFIENLSEKISNTFIGYNEGKCTTFLQHFKFTIPQPTIDVDMVPEQTYILNSLNDLKSQLSQLYGIIMSEQNKQVTTILPGVPLHFSGGRQSINFPGGVPEEIREKIINELRKIPGITDVEIKENKDSKGDSVYYTSNGQSGINIIAATITRLLNKKD